nr:cholinesterase 1-like [Penaeus vannamei]
MSEKQVRQLRATRARSRAHWVKENIGNFGGDPDKVTIVGHGTGAALANCCSSRPSRSEACSPRHPNDGSALSRWAVTWDPYTYTIQGF